MCLLCKQRIWVQTLVSTWKTAHACHDSIVGVEGRWIRTCWPANLVEQQVGEGRHQSHALTHSGLYMDTQKCYTLLCMYHTACMCACAYIYAHTKNTSLGQTRVVSYDYCNLSTLDAEAGDPHIRGQQWCIEVCTYLNRKDWSNLKIKRMLRSMQQNKNISMQMCLNWNHD